MQVDASGLDRGVPSLRLHRLQRHPGLAQPGQAGVAQLVTRPRPEQLAPAQPAQHHRRQHRPIPMRVQRTGESVDLGRPEVPRQRAYPAN
jgi:hypothetical protein